MPDLFELQRKWWKLIYGFILVSGLAGLVISLLLPRKYVAVATAAPGSNFSSDRSRIFSQNIEALYSVLGTPDDLDLVVGTARLDTLYLRVVDTLGLADDFNVSETGPERRMKVASIIKKNSSVQKGAYGELRIKVCDTKPERAALIANSILDNLRIIHQDLQLAANRSTLEALIAEKARKDTAINTASVYDTLISQYHFLVNNRPPVLLTIENARTPQWHDRPKVLRNTIAATVLGAVFAILLALYLEKRKIDT